MDRFINDESHPIEWSEDVTFEVARRMVFDLNLTDWINIERVANMTIEEIFKQRKQEEKFNDNSKFHRSNVDSIKAMKDIVELIIMTHDLCNTQLRETEQQRRRIRDRIRTLDEKGDTGSIVNQFMGIILTVFLLPANFTEWDQLLFASLCHVRDCFNSGSSFFTFVGDDSDVSKRIAVQLDGCVSSSLLTKFPEKTGLLNTYFDARLSIDGQVDERSKPLHPGKSLLQAVLLYTCFDLKIQPRDQIFAAYVEHYILKIDHRKYPRYLKPRLAKFVNPIIRSQKKLVTVELDRRFTASQDSRATSSQSSQMNPQPVAKKKRTKKSILVPSKGQHTIIDAMNKIPSKKVPKKTASSQAKQAKKTVSSQASKVQETGSSQSSKVSKKTASSQAKLSQKTVASQASKVQETGSSQAQESPIGSQRSQRTRKKKAL